MIPHWGKRYLTPLGKITVIKTFILSKFTHLFSTLPNPSLEKLQDLKNLIFSFLWDNKPDKIKRKTLYQSYSAGGLQLTDLEAFIASLKITWIRRLVGAIHKPWAILFESTITSKNNLIDLGTQYLKKIIPTLKNEFWKDVLISFLQFNKLNKPQKIE